MSPDTTTLLFLHGAGGYAEDRTLAESLARALGVRLAMPRLPDDDMSVAAWATPLRAALAAEPSHVCAHSFGATILLHLLAEGTRARSAVLLGMPHWGTDGWDVEDYAFPELRPDTPLTLHHCRDDEVVPFEHLALNARLLPTARIRAHNAGGHQFEGLASAIAAGSRGQ